MGRELYVLIGTMAASVLIAAESKSALTVQLKSPMAPPGWALLERELLRQNAAACRKFFARYFDERGYLLCIERWGGDDGPDDAIECCTDWPILHALGGDDEVLRLYKKAWEGHLRQYTQAKTTHVEFAKDGMYYKEFPVMFDWLHNGEGLTVFNLQGLSDSRDARFQQRVRRYAGFYLNEDPGAPNYDPKHKIIRSMFNGSRGPLLREAKDVDWTGDPIEVANRFQLRHGEKSYEEMLLHFRDYKDIVGDHPQNLSATTLALNAYMLAHEPKYKKWILEYVDAWRERMIQNNGIIPTKVGLDGKLGSNGDGKWYGSVYGWAFSVYDPASQKIAHRNLHFTGFIGFANAYLLTGDDKYLDVWRKQIDLVNSQKKEENGKTVYPTMYGDKGWYNYVPGKYTHNAFEIYMHSMRAEDRARLADDGWLGFLDGKDPQFPETALRHDFARLRERVAEIDSDDTTPDTRLSDDPLRLNPATVDALLRLMVGGVSPGRRGTVLHCRLRYFDPVARRAGIPKDVAALIEAMTADSVTLSLVNANQLEPRTVLIQAGGYGEHQFTGVTRDEKTTELDSKHLRVRLEPGCGGRLVLKMKRHVNQPTLALPWGE